MLRAHAQDRSKSSLKKKTSANVSLMVLQQKQMFLRLCSESFHRFKVDIIYQNTKRKTEFNYVIFDQGSGSIEELTTILSVKKLGSSLPCSQEPQQDPDLSKASQYKPQILCTYDYSQNTFLIWKNKSMLIRSSCCVSMKPLYQHFNASTNLYYTGYVYQWI